MYKEIFKLVVAIISQPGKAWDILTRKEEKDDEFLSRFVYPLIGFVTVAAFLGVLFTVHHPDRHHAGRFPRLRLCGGQLLRVSGPLDL